MSSPQFDTLTRSLASATSRRDALKVIGGSIAAGAAAFWGRGKAGQAFAAPGNLAPGFAPQQDNKNCTALLGDGSCPSGWKKEKNPGHTPSANGCGGEGSSFKPPQSFGKAQFTSSCNSHDYCYEDCTKSQADCDDAFLYDLAMTCAAAYPGAANVLQRYACYDVAAVYYAFVDSKGGPYYVAGQQQGCRCCRQKVFCACNETCYDTSAECLVSCKASLGCFTGICEPAVEGQCS